MALWPWEWNQGHPYTVLLFMFPVRSRDDLKFELISLVGYLSDMLLVLYLYLNIKESYFCFIFIFQIEN